MDTQIYKNKHTLPECRSDEPAVTGTHLLADVGGARNLVPQREWPAASCPSHLAGTHSRGRGHLGSDHPPPSGSDTCQWKSGSSGPEAAVPPAFRHGGRRYFFKANPFALKK